MAEEPGELEDEVEEEGHAPVEGQDLFPVVNALELEVETLRVGVIAALDDLRGMAIELDTQEADRQKCASARSSQEPHPCLAPQEPQFVSASNHRAQEAPSRAPSALDAPPKRRSHFREMDALKQQKEDNRQKKKDLENQVCVCDPLARPSCAESRPQEIPTRASPEHNAPTLCNPWKDADLH
mmetsp:Transcript_63791/g.156960  ORF Transcript_63791/g.156960 Transcript_63791/m.156960 type:complete len:183 (+) Transcript_63791:169-717(+)